MYYRGERVTYTNAKYHCSECGRNLFAKTMDMIFIRYDVFENVDVFNIVYPNSPCICGCQNEEIWWKHQTYIEKTKTVALLDEPAEILNFTVKSSRICWENAI